MTWAQFTVLYLLLGFVYSVRGMLRVIPKQAELGTPGVVATAGVIAVMVSTAIWPWVIFQDFKPATKQNKHEGDVR
jgi:hypothetical protein